jgi:hypothetical protein
MNMKTFLRFAAFAAVLTSSTVYAQMPAQPGQVALRVAGVGDGVESDAPIRLSSTGETPSYGSSFRATHKYRSYQENENRSKTWWKVSMAAMAGASAFDAFSSMGKSENNPLLRSSNGTFGSKGIAIKAGLAGASLVPQIFLRNRSDLRKVFTVVNFADAGVFAGVAAHNMGIKSVSK